MFRTMVIGMVVAVGFVGAALSDTAPPISANGSLDTGVRINDGAEGVVVSEVVALPTLKVFEAEGEGGNDGNSCSGEEVLRIKCKGRRPFRAIVARVRRGNEGMVLEFCLVVRRGGQVECKTGEVNSDGLAKVRFRDDLSPDFYFVEVEACGLTSKAIHCP